MDRAFVRLQARVRFMVYGTTPAQQGQLDQWTIAVPAAWVAGVAPGTSSPELTERCGQAVSGQYENWKARAIAQAEAAAAAGDAYDAGHYVLEGASVWLAHAEELRRRPWIGRRRFFSVLDDRAPMRPGTDADAPSLESLSPMEEHAFAGWRAAEVEDWASAATEYKAAFKLVPAATDRDLAGEVTAGLVRALTKVGELEGARALAFAFETSLPPAWRAMVHARLAEGYLAAGRAREAADAFAAAIAALPAADPQLGTMQSARGLALLRLSDYRNAAEALAAALAAQTAATDPNTRASTRFNLALALEHEGRAAEAEPRLREALEIRAHQGLPAEGLVLDTSIALARVLARLGRSRVAEARALLGRTRALVHPGTTAEGLHLWATALAEHVESGDTVRTLVTLDRALPMIADPAYAAWAREDRGRIAGG